MTRPDDFKRSDLSVGEVNDLRADLVALRAELAEARETLKTAIAERIETAIGAGVIDIGPPANYTKGEHFNALMVSVRDAARAALARGGTP